MKKQIAKQFRKPNGLFGRYIGNKMKKFNQPIYSKFASRLGINDADKVLEIGYGTGDTLNLIGNTNSVCKLYGIDFSRLMFNKTKKLNSGFIDSGRLELFFGNFIDFDFNTLKFTKTYCINVVYFWEDLIPGFQKAYDILEPEGVFGIYMADAKEMLKLGYTKTAVFNKHSTQHVQSCLEKVGFTDINIIEDTGNISKSYYIYSKK